MQHFSRFNKWQNYFRMFLVTFSALLVMPGQANAFNVEYYGVHMRNYTDSSKNHVRIYFGLENDGTYNSEDITWNITSPDTEVTKTGRVALCDMYYIEGNFIEGQGFNFGQVEKEACYFMNKLAGFTTGVHYGLTITGKDGDQKSIDNIAFNPETDASTGSIIAPPIVDSNTFKFSLEKDANINYLRIDWELPPDLGNNKLQIYLENSSNSNEMIYLSLPNTMEYALIPETVFKQYQNMTSALFNIRTISDDGYVRSYSDSVTVNLNDILQPDSEMTVLGVFPFSGTGFLNSDKTDSSGYTHTTKACGIEGTVSMLSNSQSDDTVCWKVDATIPDIDEKSFMLEDNSTGACFPPYIDSSVINFQYSYCWGGSCAEDPSHPGETGYSKLNLFFRTSDLGGPIAISDSNNGNAGDSMNYEFLGNVFLNLE